MWDLPGPGLEPGPPALAGGFLTTVPPGKSPECSFNLVILWCPFNWSDRHVEIVIQWIVYSFISGYFCHLNLILRIGTLEWGEGEWYYGGNVRELFAVEFGVLLLVIRKDLMVWICQARSLGIRSCWGWGYLEPVGTSLFRCINWSYPQPGLPAFKISPHVLLFAADTLLFDTASSVSWI